MTRGTSDATSGAAKDLQARRVAGCRIVYFDRGAGSALVLVHGMFGDHLDWEPVLEPLAARHRVIAVDLPGFGASDKPDREYTADFFLETLDGLLEELGVERAALAGNSFGGILATLYAARHPDRVSRLILVAGGGLRPFSERERQLYTARFSEQAIAALTPALQTEIFAPIFARESPHRERYLAKQHAKLARPDFPAYARSVARAVRLAVEADLGGVLPQLVCPTLLLWGAADLVLPVAQAREALGRLARGELRVLPGCGHVPQLDWPEGFTQVVEAFLAGRGGAAQKGLDSSERGL